MLSDTKKPLGKKMVFEEGVGKALEDERVILAFKKYQGDNFKSINRNVQPSNFNS